MMSGRSKGCVTCKARKIKCSEEKPSCQKCRASDRKCGGYGPVLRFVDENPRIRRKKNVESIQINEMFSATNPISSHLQHKEFTSFLATKLRGVNGSCGVGSDPRIWLNDMENSRHQSLDALGAIFYGLANHSQDIVVLALGIYGYALAEMRRKLADSQKRADFGTLASITTLCMFELANFRSGNGWILHAQCLERLLNSDEPPRQRGTAKHSLFFVQRTLLVSQALVCERRTILSQHKWKTVPWAEDPSSKQPFDFLIDIYCDIADLRADLREFRGRFDVKMHRVALKRTLALVTDLNSWWRSWIETNVNVCWETDVNINCTLLRDEDGPLYSRSLEYSDIDAAFAVCSHDAARIFLLHALRCLGGIPTQFQFETLSPQSKTPLLGISSDIEGLGHEILRSIEYCSTQSGHFIGNFSAVLILDVAYSALKKDSRAAMWLLKNSRMKFQAAEAAQYSGGRAGFTMLRSCQVAPKLPIQNQ